MTDKLRFAGLRVHCPKTLSFGSGRAFFGVMNFYALIVAHPPRSALLWGLSSQPDTRITPRSLLFIAASAAIFSSCKSYQRTIADSNSRVEFVAEDFTITPPYQGYAQQTRILGIDFARLFTVRDGSVGSITGFSIPLVGSVLGGDPVDGYALYELLKSHPGYDAVFYPQFERKGFNFLFIYQRSKVQVKARLGRLNVGTGDGDKGMNDD